ncbi:MAG: HDIG domain-containing protein [Opitutales bacterium]|nr:HDIG domain-containing protein [Opitutales bacterium]MDG1325699.1 HDIG domain-containing protein [Opitutales bacterium]
MEENKSLRKKSGRKLARRRKSLEEGSEDLKLSSGVRGVWENLGKQVFFTLIFATSIVFICFVGQDPPGLRSLGEVAPENVYSDRAFSFQSEIRRRDAEEWIRSSTPREFSQNIAGEESFKKAMIRLEEGLILLSSMDLESQVIARESLCDELEANFNLNVRQAELDSLFLWRNFSNPSSFFEIVKELLGKLHLTGVVKFPSLDQKFHSEANATLLINNTMLNLSNNLIVIEGIENGMRFNLDTETLAPDFPELSLYLNKLKEHLSNDGPFPEAGLLLEDFIESGDENASFSAQQFRNELAGNLSVFVKKGLFLRDIDREATTAAQNRAIAEMEQPVVMVQEGDVILKKGSKLTESDLEKFGEFLALTVEDRDLLPKRIFITCGTFLIAIFYISLVLPNFWRDTIRSTIVAVAILSNLCLSRLILELGSTDLFGGNTILIGLIPYLIPIAFAPMIVMITVGPRMAALSALMTSIFHATMQNAGIEALAISLSAGLVGAFFCREIRLRGSALKAGAMAGLTGAVLALGIGFAAGGGGVASVNHALASLVMGVLTGGLVLTAMPLIEHIFKVATDATLFELTDFNHPLLRKMQVEAPGTYHHSLMVANLSENAAVAVGANPILCRACSLFHDIGKMAQPHYFTENQGEFGNPHNRQNPAMSALIIKSHVKEGIEMARASGLPKIFRDVIRQHHGTTLVKYFYHQAKQKIKQEKLPYGELDIEEPDESTYRYDGPKPRFKESAIIFFADSVEAAARSLPKVTQHSVEELLESIFQDRLEDRQLDECPLTLEEVAKIKKSFIKTTLNMLHTRIEYPEEEKNTKPSGRDSSSPFSDQSKK